jgi:dissimilatory sulfite reductase related protein
VSEDKEQKVKQPHTRCIADVEILFDGEGFFMNPSQWTEKVFSILARESGVEEISEKQLMVIRFIRKFYLEQGKSPLNQHIKIGTNMSLIELEALFPGGIKYGARRLAGLPNPKGCRKGVGAWNTASG